MVTINETGQEELPTIFVDEGEEEEGHDGWGPIRPRRSSMPPDHPDAHPHEAIPMICLPTRHED